MRFRALADRVLSTLLAPPCAACGAVLEHPLEGAVCARCWQRVVLLTPPLCDLCGDPLPSWRIASFTAGRCPRCRRRASAIDRMRAIGPYRDELRAIVHALKYDGRRSLAPRLGALMRTEGQALLEDADAVVPVPLHPRRRRQRGFNQAALLAAHLERPVRDILRRVVHTHPQVDLPAARRHRNVRDAFQIATSSPLPYAGFPALAGVGSAFRRTFIAGGSEDPPLRERDTPLRESETVAPRVEAGLQTRLRPVDGAVLVLVDDVVTTGATLEACARVLKAAGAREVRALTAARVVSAQP